MQAARMIHIRVAVTLLVIIMCSAKFTPVRRRKQSPIYPLEVHQMFRERFSKSDKSRTEGVWSPWSSWSPCSRSCGGGVTSQIRHCVPKSSAYSSGRENQRRRRRKRKLGNHCIGLYKRFHLCNTQKCPGGTDFRREQCTSFNKNPFKGKYYFWEPFLQAGDECALNCRPMGMRFYATLNKTVVDGTSCFHPLTATGKAAPPGTLGVCIDGRCKSVASNGVIGSVDETPEECAACLKGSCRSVSGLYTKPDLSPGYSLVAQIPQGACRILVQQLKHTKNVIALRNANGSFIINGDWKFSPSRTVEGAGTRFIYRKQDTATLETITAAGSLTNPVDIMILYQQPNLGIKYGYALPIETPPSVEQIAPPYVKRPMNPVGLEPRRLDPPLNSVTQRDEARPPTHTYRRRIRRRFAWKISGVSACSKSCGGGMQTTIFSCVREHTQTSVSDKRCAHLERPLAQQIRCNLQACPAFWGGVWGPCTGSCGQGVQHFIIQCQQDSAPGQTLVVNDVACLRPKPHASSRPCRLAPCENESDNELHQNPDADNMIEVQEWKVGPWSQCSVSCGTGQRTRIVSCISGRCPPEKRPSHAEYCDSGSCAVQGQVSHWLVSDWSQCSEACGTGTQTRLTVCGNDVCEASTKPEMQRACSSDRYCIGQWFIGPWSACSDSCNGSSKQIREVTCIVKLRGQSRITNEMTCSVQDKPPTERLCQGSCPPKWFVGEWNICECPTSTQRREVRCMDRNGTPSNHCTDTERPVIKRPCACERREDQMNKLAHDEPQDHTCIDKVSNCYLAVQARLCQYAYYINNCCVSCRKSPQDSKQ